MKPIVGSSNIKAVAHDPKRNRLSVRFSSGDVYHYSNVSAAQHKAFLAAESPGSWLAEHVVRKPQTHPYEKEAKKK